MRKIYVLGLALLMAAMMALPANAAMWVGGEIGANFIASTNLNLSVPAVGTLKFKSVNFSPAVIGGGTIGYDFVNAGFAGYSWPDWMKYFGFAVDFTYNRIPIRNQFCQATVNGVSLGNTRIFPPGRESNSDIPVLAFLFYGHYGFFPDSEITVGRVHPYLGVGPAIAWTNLDASPYGVGTKSSTNVALATEAGIRFIALPTVTIDVGFRYRYLTPSWSFTTPTGTRINASVDSVNSFSFLARVAYHF